MITLIAAGIGLLILVAIVVGIVDATQAPEWRRIAAERRARWEAKQPQLHGLDPYAGSQFHDDIDDIDDESWDDD
jgi:hypothetical protein